MTLLVIIPVTNKFSSLEATDVIESQSSVMGRKSDVIFYFDEVF